MLIALDARSIYAPQRRATGKGLINLYRALGEVRPDWRVIAFHRQPGRVDKRMMGTQVATRRVEMVGDRFDAWERIRLPLAARRVGANVLHCPSGTCPNWMPIDTIVTINDFHLLDAPEAEVPPLVRKRVEQSTNAATRRASWIVCPSKFIRDRLVSEFSVDPDRLSLVQPASDMEPEEASDITMGVFAKYGIEDKYALHFGGAAARKNTKLVLEAWSLQHESTHRMAQLLVVGLDVQTKRELSVVAHRLGIQNRVSLHGFVEDDELRTLLHGARALIYPSRCEGFGAEILDAWATETPVLTSYCSSFPELAGDAAMYADPEDPCGIARGMHRVIREAPVRRNLIDLGHKRLARYSWDLTAEQFAQSIEKASGAITRRRKAAA